MTAIEHRILRLYSNASYRNLVAGFNWYTDANQQCANVAVRYGVTLEQCCGVVAALSPGLQWEYNIEHAQLLIEAWRKRGAIPVVGVYGRANRDKALRILNGECVAACGLGLKTNAFYQCIMEPLDPDPVCVDRHAFSAAYGKSLRENELHGAVVGVVAYRNVSECYRRVARWCGMLSNRLQAVVWLEWRERVHDN